MRRDDPEVRLVSRTNELLRALSHVDPQPVIDALAPHVTERRLARMREVIWQRVGSVTVVLDNLHDPHNGAAVLRSCDAFGVSRVYAAEEVEPLLASNAVARGSHRWVEVEGFPTALAAVERLHAEGFQLVATHPEGDLVPADLNGIDKLALVMGNERDGIQAAFAEASAHRVRIPMRGFVESLNVSVTAAILLQGATAQRPGDLPDAERLRLLARGLVQTVARAPEVLREKGLRIPVVDD